MSSSDFYFQLQYFEHSILIFARSLTKSIADSEDLMQDTIYKALKNIDKFKRGTNFKAWLMTIMRNTFINNYRKKKKWKINDINDPVVLNNINTSQHEINEGDKYFLRAHINSSIEKLENHFSVPFELFVKGFKYNEIAEKLNIPVGTVKSRIFKARKQLQIHLAEYDITSSTYNI